MFGKMIGQRLAITGNMKYDFQKNRDSGVTRDADINAFATVNQKSTSIMVWNYHDKDSFSAATPVNISIEGIASVKKALLTKYRIDNEFSNSYEAWKKMGSPQTPSKEQVALLNKAGQLTQSEPNKTISITKGQFEINITLPRQAVSLIQLNWE